MSTRMLNARNKRVLTQYIKQAAVLYNKYLLNRDFLIICDDFSTYKIRFHRRKFKHLTGIKTSLSEINFFNNALNGIIAESDLNTQQKYDFSTLKKKCCRLTKADLFLNSHTKTTLLLECLHTNTYDFPIAINNIELDMCVACKSNHSFFEASSLRTSSNSKNASKIKTIICVISKMQSEEKFTNINYISNIKLIVNNVPDFKNIISDEIADKFSYII